MEAACPHAAKSVDVSCGRTVHNENCWKLPGELFCHECRNGHYSNPQNGGAVYAGTSATVDLINCVLATNKCLRTGDAAYAGGAVGASSATVHIYNSIFYLNSAAEATAPQTIYLNGGSVDVNFSWLDGTNTTFCSAGVTFGDGVIGEVGGDPLFASQFDDLHLQSAAGRWDPTAGGGAGGWVRDPESSVCIDTGADVPPYNEYDPEPNPDGNRINMGIYGGTTQASKATVITGTLFLIW